MINISLDLMFISSKTNKSHERTKEQKNDRKKESRMNKFTISQLALILQMTCTTKLWNWFYSDIISITCSSMHISYIIKNYKNENYPNLLHSIYF